MREALTNLTIRGKSLMSVGLALIVLSILLGEKDLLRVAVLVALLPFASAFVLSRTRYNIVAHRSLQPPRIAAGQQARVTLRLRNLSRIPTGSMMLEDNLPYALGSRPRLVLERLLGGGGSKVSYSVGSDFRGRYEIGPLTVRLTDPFGLVEVTRTYLVSDHLTVTPPILPLPPVRLPGEFSGRGETRARAVAVHGEDDAATREYRHGDDLRRVHWPSTAHSGELMVRREEQPWDSRATVLLDVRAAGHRGEGPTSSFEWGVSAAASIVNHLRRGGYQLRLVTEDIEVEPDPTSDGSLMDYLAGVQPHRQGSVAKLLERAGQGDTGGLLIAAIGSLSTQEAERLAGLHSSAGNRVALLIDSMSWLSLTGHARAEAEKAYQLTTATLMRGGWRVVPIRNGDNLAVRWRDLSRGRHGFAHRAAMAETVAPQGGPR
ncbi:DUF58 domain-containing protein [Stackebrandtia nassauensis]|uniref:DUF58 domain-containing protein n=1 Tax=Stackebrandtia nassauensis (strain DSM 44728 / CIP 108903 / NRRL B-16338 / NBRC 102104 / LLR-40K-21) TaxID=446470 RepID=D3Q9L1_STANL|nr:DUF58 domain-containing protein [Stackebrandtia nassauensis]ADD44557.1 protein of unknown function DUF58 [Stackebrandtia nassauensis DSM 44728]